jgi:hypothetical protein
MKQPEHLRNDLLIKALDEELSGCERVAVEAHIATCEKCRDKLEELRCFSDGVETLVGSCIPVYPADARENLASRMNEICSRPTHAAPRKLVWQIGLGMGIAATLALAVLFAPHYHQATKPLGSSAVAAQSNTFEIDGETFIALPYSNPDLPLAGPHIVEMQVPVASLQDAGIVFEPVSNEISAPDRSVLADVLLGMDGQPLGVHILETD